SPGWLVFSTGFAGGQLVESAKRASDVFIALVLLLLTWPLMLIAAIAIVLESGRPVFYQQTRVGLGGKTFSIFKFRSMVVNAEKEGEAVWATAKDSRVTPVGAVLRNTRIDELPQLWNVLRGDMSFVGPRPERPEFVQGFAETLPFYNERHRVKPGLMGWAQLNYPYGASDEDAEQKLRYDLYYVKNKSLMLDLVIMVQTVQVILLGMGVH
ncbi:MAG: exopolysaccharide biosynthesis polyprenyl glycosylphosphotransferase, partial [Pseudomonadales bacterium]